MNKSDIDNILDKYKAGTASKEEVDLLQSWSMSYVEPGEANLSMEERIQETDLIWRNLQETAYEVKKARLWPRIAVAASILILFSLGGYFWMQNSFKANDANVAGNDISPGKNSAVLTLANGKKILLNDASDGQLASEAGIVIRKTKNGQLIYEVTGASTQNANQFNTLETRNGEQYQVMLPDGSHIWLNAASSLRYPTAFSGRDRVVELKGEGYFEIAHNKLKPFKVNTSQQQVMVLGTHFNINAYDEEPLTKTTLMEGSVQVSSLVGSSSSLRGSIPRQSSDTPPVLLKPGEQAILIGNQLNVSKGNIEEAMAWKNGLFMFESENIESIMRKIARWYNVEVVYRGELPVESFSGVVNRFGNVSQVLHLLSLTNRVHFKIEEGRIIVTK